MKKVFIGILLLLSFVSGAKCSEDKYEKDITNDITIGFGFLNQCKNIEQKKLDYIEGICLGYFKGMFDSMRMILFVSKDRQSDLEKTFGINLAEVHKKFINFLKNNTKELHTSTFMLLLSNFPFDNKGNKK